MSFTAASPALLPLLSAVYSLLVSPHCGLMCLPFVPEEADRSRFFAARVLSYTLVGAILGALGAGLRGLMEFRALAAFAFVVQVVLTLGVLGLRVWPRRRMGVRAPLTRGLLFGFMPCATLGFYYSLATLTGSVVGGALVLFGHAVMSMPALAWCRGRVDRRLATTSSRWMRLALVAFCAYDLLQLGRTLIDEPTAAHGGFCSVSTPLAVPPAHALVPRSSPF